MGSNDPQREDQEFFPAQESICQKLPLQHSLSELRKPHALSFKTDSSVLLHNQKNSYVQCVFDMIKQLCIKEYAK